MRRFFLSLGRISILVLFLLSSATLHGEEATHEKKPQHQDQLPGAETRALVSNIAGDQVPRQLSLVDFRGPGDWAPASSSYRLSEEWFPFSVKPPFGKDDGTAKPWMVYASVPCCTVVSRNNCWWTCRMFRCGTRTIR